MAPMIILAAAVVPLVLGLFTVGMERLERGVVGTSSEPV